MKDVFFKLKALFYLLKDSTLQWKDDVWGVNLDDTHCCSGDECKLTKWEG